MTDLNKEIEAMATDLVKSSKTSKEVLFDTIRSLGAEGLKAKLPTLEKSERDLVVSALEEMALAKSMKKAVEMDKDYAAKYVQGKITDTKIQEDKADDDQDEKLVKPEAAKMDNQGTPTPGWEGQVIKGDKMDKEEVKEIADKEASKEVESHEDKMHAAKKKVKSGKTDEMKEGMKEMKKALEEKLGSTDAELIKGEMKKLLAEESQDGDAPEMNEATRAKKESVPAIEPGLDNKKNMTKSTPWTDENALLKANTGGRNHHFSMDEYLDAVLAAAQNPTEEVKKSEGESKEDLNDIIEKGGDRNMKHFETEKLMSDNKKKSNGKIVKSFSDNEIAQALGLSEEEAKKLLGE